MIGRATEGGEGFPADRSAHRYRITDVLEETLAAGC